MLREYDHTRVLSLSVLVLSELTLNWLRSLTDRGDVRDKSTNTSQ